MALFHEARRASIARSQQRAASVPQSQRAYRAEAAEIELQIAQLQAKLKSHRDQQDADPTNWGFTGDLRHVRDVPTPDQCMATEHAYARRSRRSALWLR